MKNWIIIASVQVFLLLLACGKSEDVSGITTTETKIYGVVQDTNQTPIHGARVALYKVNTGSINDTTQVDELVADSGSYSFSKLDSGDYFVIASVGDSLAGISKLINLVKNESVQINITVVILIQQNFYITNNYNINNTWVLSPIGTAQAVGDDSVNVSFFSEDTSVVAIESIQNGKLDTVYYWVYEKDGFVKMEPIVKEEPTLKAEFKVSVEKNHYQGVMALGNDFSLVIQDHYLWASGNNAHAELCTDSVVRYTTPHIIAENVAYVSASRIYQNSPAHTLFIKDNGDLYGCGTFDLEEEGVVKSVHTSPAYITNQVWKVSAGGLEFFYHTLILKKDSSLWGLGDNTYHQLGESSLQTILDPVKIADSVIEISAGSYQNFFIKSNHTLWTMGVKGNVYKADESAETISKPVMILDSVSQVFSAYYYTLVRKLDGSIWGRGFEEYGDYELGEDWVKIRDEGVQMTGGHSVFFILDSQGQVWSYSELSAPASPAFMGKNWIEYGENHGFAIGKDDNLFGWGFDFQCAFGRGTPLSDNFNDFLQEPILIWNR